MIRFAKDLAPQLPWLYARSWRSMNNLGRCYCVPRRFLEGNEAYRRRIMMTIQARIFGLGSN